MSQESQKPDSEKVTNLQALHDAYYKTLEKLRKLNTVPKSSRKA
ncbi:MAG: hypothetical protein Q6353_014075 [Candidatus Sigynarchaeum springense]